jgi:hypothetical protein
VFILEYYFASKSFLAIREIFVNAYVDREEMNKTTVHTGNKISGCRNACVYSRKLLTFTVKFNKFFIRKSKKQLTCNIILMLQYLTGIVMFRLAFLMEHAFLWNTCVFL